MTDAAFDHIENELKESGSKVVEQVGSKRKDFDFTHPTPMKSLAKHQTGNVNGKTDYVVEAFNAWYAKRYAQIGKRAFLLGSPKFDGNAINIIYKGKNHLQTLTRGDGRTGKDITERFRPVIPATIMVDRLDIKEDDIIEIRCEVVIAKDIFQKKYSEFANPRNFVAGVIGKDDYSIEKVKDLTIVPLHYLLNGEHVAQVCFCTNKLFSRDWNQLFNDIAYVNTIKYYEDLREGFPFQLDGVVISFPEEYRKQLGENDHDPEWAVAIKFVPDQVFSDYVGIEWNISKRGEMAPVILLKPVQLAGTTVKRASGYNAGYIQKNWIGPGAVFSIAKAGDIIPEIQEVILKSLMPVTLPEVCPACGGGLEFDGIHLMCNNEDCVGKAVKKLAYGAALLDLKGIGGKTMAPFAEDFSNIYELMVWVLSLEKYHDIEKYGIKKGSRSEEIFVNAFKNIKSIPYETVIVMLGYNNVGRKLSAQVAREHCGLEPNYTSLERALVAKLHEPEVEKYIKQAVMNLESLGIKIDKPQNNNDMKTEKICVTLTGSPKLAGYKTKEEFMANFPELQEVSLTDKACSFLITDSYSSTSSKMGVAKKKGIKIVTYEDYK
jgi:DNA ligase (NAD+)